MDSASIFLVLGLVIATIFYIGGGSDNSYAILGKFFGGVEKGIRKIISFYKHLDKTAQDKTTHPFRRAIAGITVGILLCVGMAGLIIMTGLLFFRKALRSFIHWI